MDIATIIGLLGAFGLIFSAMDDPGAFIDTPSMLIVVAGSTAVVLFLMLPWRVSWGHWRSSKNR